MAQSKQNNQPNSQNIKQNQKQKYPTQTKSFTQPNKKKTKPNPPKKVNQKQGKKPLKKEVVYAFIDSQNLNLGVQSLGWKLDYQKFRVYLKDKYNVEKAYLFIGYVDDNTQLYEKLDSFGYEVIYKPTVEDQEGAVKGNVDAELVLHAMIHFDSYDKAIIVSNDGDFYCLAEYLAQKNKLAQICVTSNTSYSSLLKQYGKYFFYIDALKKKLQRTSQRKSQETSQVKSKEKVQVKTQNSQGKPQKKSQGDPQGKPQGKPQEKSSSSTENPNRQTVKGSRAKKKGIKKERH